MSTLADTTYGRRDIRRVQTSLRALSAAPIQGDYRSSWLQSMTGAIGGAIGDKANAIGDAIGDKAQQYGDKIGDKAQQYEDAWKRENAAKKEEETKSKMHFAMTGLRDVLAAHGKDESMKRAFTEVVSKYLTTNTGSPSELGTFLSSMSIELPAEKSKQLFDKMTDAANTLEILASSLDTLRTASDERKALMDSMKESLEGTMASGVDKVKSAVMDQMKALQDKLIAANSSSTGVAQQHESILKAIAESSSNGSFPGGLETTLAALKESMTKLSQDMADHRKASEARMATLLSAETGPTSSSGVDPKLMEDIRSASIETKAALQRFEQSHAAYAKDVANLKQILPKDVSVSLDNLKAMIEQQQKDTASLQTASDGVSAMVQSISAADSMSDTKEKKADNRQIILSAVQDAASEQTEKIAEILTRMNLLKTELTAASSFVPVVIRSS